MPRFVWADSDMGGKWLPAFLKCTTLTDLNLPAFYVQVTIPYDVCDLYLSILAVSGSPSY